MEPGGVMQMAEALEREHRRRARGEPIPVDEHGFIWLHDSSDTCWVYPVALPPWAVVLAVTCWHGPSARLTLAACSPVGGKPEYLWVLESVEDIQRALITQREMTEAEKHEVK